MTLLLSWLAVDSRRPSSLYIASDSRLSWGNTSKYDQGKKVFSFRNSPDIIGYCGDVLFPTVSLNQLISMADDNLLFAAGDNCDTKFNKIKTHLQAQLKLYPSTPGIIDNTVQILYGSRDSSHVFHLYNLTWHRRENMWYDEKLAIPDYSNTLTVLGSGRNEFLDKLKLYQRSDIGKTSRAIFQCFCDTLNNIQNKYCGGSPQLVGLFQKGNGLNFGIIWNGRRYFSGAEIPYNPNLDVIQWRNEEFEICSGDTMKKVEKAQRQPNPLLLKRQFPGRPLF